MVHSYTHIKHTYTHFTHVHNRLHSHIKHTHTYTPTHQTYKQAHAHIKSRPVWRFSLGVGARYLVEAQGKNALVAFSSRPSRRTTTHRGRSIHSLSWFPCCLVVRFCSCSFPSFPPLLQFRLFLFFISTTNLLVFFISVSSFSFLPPSFYFPSFLPPQAAVWGMTTHARNGLLWTWFALTSPETMHNRKMELLQNKANIADGPHLRALLAGHSASSLPLLLLLAAFLAGLVVKTVTKSV